MSTACQRFLEAKALEAKRPGYADKTNPWHSFYKRKAERTKLYFQFEFGWKKRACGACMGSGKYDACGSPDCGACDGSGKESYAAEKSLRASAPKETQAVIKSPKTSKCH